jgi:hypothetical protein
MSRPVFSLGKANEMLDATDKVIEGLDAIQVAALRKASRVCFYHCPKPDASGETSYICAIKEHAPSPLDPFAPHETSILIPCDWRLREYTRHSSSDAIPYGSDQFNAFEWVNSAQSDEVWQTTASLLRVGDKLTLRWSRGGFTTESMENATPHFYGDALFLDVQRGDKRLSFHVDTSVCENNSARMIRRA